MLGRHSLSSCFRFILAATALLAAVGCVPEEPANGGDTEPTVTPVWTEDDDEGNEHPSDAELISLDWTTDLEIQGSAASCDFDGSEDWPWQGDEDSYQVEPPADGFLEVILSWEATMDLDLLVYFSPPGNNANPDETIAANNNDGPEIYLFEEEVDGGDDIVLTVACATGSGGAYTLWVGWEN